MKQEGSFRHVLTYDALWSLLASIVLLVVSLLEGCADFLSTFPGLLLRLFVLDLLDTSRYAYWLCVSVSILVWCFGFSYIALKYCRLLARAMLCRGDARWALLGGLALMAFTTPVAFITQVDWDWILFPGPFVMQAVVFVFPLNKLMRFFMDNRTAAWALAFLLSLNCYFVLGFGTLKGYRLILRASQRFYNRKIYQVDGGSVVAACKQNPNKEPQ